MDRFSQRLWKEHKPFISRYDPDSTNPLHKETMYGCDICNDERGTREAPDKCKIKWCRKCHVEVVENFNLTEDDISYV